MASAGLDMPRPAERTSAIETDRYMHYALLGSYPVCMSLNSYLIDREVARPTVGEVLDRAGQRADRARTSALDSIAAARADQEEQLGSRTSA